MSVHGRLEALTNRSAQRAGGLARALRVHSAAVLAALAMVSGCATLQPPHAEGAQVLTGRLSVRVDSEPVRALSAAFELSGTAREGALSLTSPLGNTLAQARWKPNDVVLETPGSLQRYPDLDTMAARRPERVVGRRRPGLFAAWLARRARALRRGLGRGQPRRTARGHDACPARYGAVSR